MSIRAKVVMGLILKEVASTHLYRNQTEPIVDSHNVIDKIEGN